MQDADDLVDVLAGRRVCWALSIASRMVAVSSSRSMPTIPARGTMMSSTVAFSRSRMPTSIACRSGGRVVCSLSTVFSSATESCSDFSSARAIDGAAAGC